VKNLNFLKIQDSRRPMPAHARGRYTQSNWAAGGSIDMVRMPTGVHYFEMHILAQPGKYDWTVHVQRQCGLMSNYF